MCFALKLVTLSDTAILLVEEKMFFFHSLSCVFSAYSCLLSSILVSPIVLKSRFFSSKLADGPNLFIINFQQKKNFKVKIIVYNYSAHKIVCYRCCSYSDWCSINDSVLLWLTSEYDRYNMQTYMLQDW